MYPNNGLIYLGLGFLNLSPNLFLSNAPMLGLLVKKGQNARYFGV
jgi:hypothetical protein